PQRMAAARRLEPSLCRPGKCCVRDLFPAGRDRAGQTLTVVQVDRAASDECLLPSSGRGKPWLPKAFQENTSAPDCHPYEYHLIAERDGKVTLRRFLAEECNDNY